jgi:amino acid adenylation domain-containing protein
MRPEEAKRMEKENPVQIAGKARDIPGVSQQLVDHWNDTQTEYPRDKSIAQVFEEQARRTPEAIAVEFEGRVLSYAELNRRANRVAKKLGELGIGEEELVGCCFERSIEWMTAILGILKAGGCYVPLDGSYPLEQLRYMLQDTGAKILLTQGHLAGNVRDAMSSEPVALDESEELPAGSYEENPPGKSGARSLAYVMYTSGSTGRPKGVMVEQRAVVRLVKNTNYCDFAGQTFLHLAPISFDASTFEIWGALLNGCRLVIAPSATPSLADIGNIIREKGVGTLWLTAGLFHLMVEQRIEDLRPLRQLLAGGDRLSPKHVARVLETLPELRLINGYGPTEATTFTCCHTFRRNELIHDPVPIGGPISNTRVYIVDTDLQPVMAGEIGELLIGGDGVARGYLNDPEKTAEKFVEIRLGSGAKRERVYRTGDRARYLGDGTIEFHGRTDHQIKLRGYRIELGEIEAVLRKHEGVSEACVVAEREGVNAKRLLAFCVPTENRGANAGELREYLQNNLPSFMAPATITLLDEMPLTANGKIDRNALATMDRGGEQNETETAAPKSIVEETVLAVWRRVLRVDKIRFEDNFFDLGGDSLQLLEAHAELEKLLQIKIPIVELFQYTSANALIQWIEGNRRQSNVFDDVQAKARKQKEMFARQRQSRVGGGI